MAAMWCSRHGRSPSAATPSPRARAYGWRCGRCTGGDKPGCYEYKGTADNPDNYDAYFTTATAAQATTNPGAINVDWDTFDPFGLGLAELFTLHVTGTLTVPVSGSYTFGVNAFGGGWDIIYGGTYDHRRSDPTVHLDRDRAVGGRGHDRRLSIHPRRSSCESTDL